MGDGRRELYVYGYGSGGDCGDEITTADKEPLIRVIVLMNNEPLIRVIVLMR
jgi:hypothetical protein